MLFLLLALSFVAQAQSRNFSSIKYYFDINRPDCCRISNKDWQQIAARLSAARIPTFFGLYDVLNYKETWHPAKLHRTSANGGWLILGPFNSEASAMAALYKLPKLLPNHSLGEDERRKGVEPDPFGYPQNWVIGMYQIVGFKTQASEGIGRQSVSSPRGSSSGSQGLIGLVDNSDYRYRDGCGCSLWPSPRDRNLRHHYYLLTSLGDTIGKRAWMNIDGRVRALSLLSTTGPAPNRRGSKFIEVYRGGDVTARITYIVSNPNKRGGEVTKYSATITVTKGNRSQTIRAVGDCGC
jgi:hypothetical protein